MPTIADGELTSVAICWRLERSDGAGLALTSHDKVIVTPDASYQPEPGMVPAAVTRSLGLEPHSAQVDGALSSEALDAADLALGRWDGARMRLTAIDWQDPEADTIQLIAGEIGTVSINGDAFSADLLGAAARLANPVCPATSAECRAQFGDKACRVNLAGRTATAMVVSVSGADITLDQTFDGRFILGRLRYMSGANCGTATVILAVNAAVITVRDLPRATVATGAKIELREGCDKLFSTCVERFGNGINFRGEPYLPGNDLLTRSPGA